jgi:NAD(P)-dependent dehydrogenase (short-subunit alcohol dehydrogenase family)
MTKILEGKVAILTGAARGLGQAMARRMKDEGATVVLSDIDEAALSTAADELDARGVVCDVRDEEQVQKLVSDTVAEHGHLDVMVANAGIATVTPIVKMTLQEWRDVLAVDLDGVFLCTKHAGAAMASNGGGSIINIASIKAFGGSPAIASYGASKAGVVSLTKTAAIELRAHGVRVNAICPGWIGTEMVTSHVAEFEQVLGISMEDYIGHIQGRLGEPDEVAGLAVFLASDRSRFSSGSAYVVDGGARASLV